MITDTSREFAVTSLYSIKTLHLLFLVYLKEHHCAFTFLYQLNLVLILPLL